MQATRRFDLGGFTLLPAAGLQYVHLFDGGFSESGSPGFDLDVSRRNSDSLRPFVGVSAAKAFTTENGLRLVPEADISYSHELMSTPPSLVQVGGVCNPWDQFYGEAGRSRQLGKTDKPAENFRQGNYLAAAFPKDHLSPRCAARSRRC